MSSLNYKHIRRNRAIFTILTAVVFMLSVSLPASATPYTQSWDLVDSSKHLDYNGNSIYMSNINTGAAIWNGYKSGVIRKASILYAEDVYVSDINQANGSTGITYPNGKIEMNIYYLRNCTSSQRTNTATHELGHALGLGHSTSSDIMYAAQTSKTTLSQNDKDSYDAAYKKY